MSIRVLRLLAAISSVFIGAPAFAQATAGTEMPPPPAIEVGQVAPDFSLPWADANGTRATPFRLSDARGKVVVLAFYPRDHSSGCTAQLTKFRDEYTAMFGSEALVIPISVDSLSTHQRWASEMKFPFALASDTDLSVAKMYGSWAPGRTTSTRTVFVIGKDGRILYRNLRFPALVETAYSDLAAEVAKAR